MKKKLYNVWKHLLHALFYVFRIFPIDKEKIVFSNFDGKGFGDNPKYIAIELKKKRSEMKMIWVVHGGADKGLPEWIRSVKLGSIRSIYEYSTAGIWVDNSRKPTYIEKRKGQFYIQTWHAGIPGKKVEKDTVTQLPESWIAASKHDSEMADCFVSNCKFASKHFRTAFWYSGNIVEYGYPRNDILFYGDHVKEVILRNLGIKSGTKIVLYAPTFRNSKKDVYDIDMHGVEKALQDRFGGEWIGLVRLHPLMTRDQFKFDKKLIDCTDYPDMYELLRIADVEITDYSSSIFEFACLQGKPAFTYGKDVEEYREERGFYYDVMELPFPFAKTNAELLSKIRSFDEAHYEMSLRAFNDEIGWYEDGNAATRIVQLIVDKVEGETEYAQRRES